jgi:hypothetical protein
MRSRSATNSVSSGLSAAWKASRALSPHPTRILRRAICRWRVSDSMRLTTASCGGPNSFSRSYERLPKTSDHYGAIELVATLTHGPSLSAGYKARHGHVYALVGGKPAALLHLQSLLLVWDTVRRGRRASCGSGSGSPSTSPGRCSSTPRSTVGTTSSSSPRRPGKAGTPSGGRAGRPTIRMCAPAQVFGVTPYLLGGSCVRASLRPRPARPRESVRSLCAP